MSPALIAKLLRSPLSAAQEYWGEDSDDDDDHDNMPSLSSMPALRRPSDIMAAYWLRNNLAPKSLSYYFALDVQNDETLPLITSVLDRRGLERMPPWPGVKVGMWEEEGEALLGSPLGAIVAYLLVQHKENLGRKHVTEITIFREDDVIGEQQDMVEVNLLFWIKDVPTSQVEREHGKMDDAHKMSERSVVRREYYAEKGVRVHEFGVA